MPKKLQARLHRHACRSRQTTPVNYETNHRQLNSPHLEYVWHKYGYSGHPNQDKQINPRLSFGVGGAQRVDPRYSRCVVNKHRDGRVAKNGRFFDNCNNNKNNNNKQQTTNNKQLQDMNTCGLRGKDINLLRRPQPMPKRLGNDNIYPSPNQCKL
jgi:hypothetical protein